MRAFLFCLLLLLLPGGSFAAGNQAVAGVRTFLAADAAHAGSEVKAAVVARIAPGYHINDRHPSLDYLIPTKIEWKKTPALSAEKVFYPRGKSRKFAFLDSPLSVYEGETRFGVILRVSPSLSPGTYRLRGSLDYQACNDHACLPPAKFPFQINVRVVAPGVAVKPANSQMFKEINFR